MKVKLKTEERRKNFAVCMTPNEESLLRSLSKKGSRAEGLQNLIKLMNTLHDEERFTGKDVERILG